MLIQRSFVYANDTDSHKDGWRPAHIPEFNAGSGYHVAHDTLEHFEDVKVGFDGEMRAFGTTLYGRAEGYYWSQVGAFDDHVSKILRNDFVGFLAQSGKELTDPGKTRALTPFAEDIMDGLAHWARMARPQFPDEHAVSEREFEKRLKWAFGWIRRGYRDAKAKYKGTSQRNLAKLFIKVVETVDAIDADTLYLDDKLTVSVDTITLSVTTEVAHAGQRAGKRRHRAERQDRSPSFAEFVRAITGNGGGHADEIRRALGIE